jgi:A/G-specific adenine glycosylase
VSFGSGFAIPPAQRAYFRRTLLRWYVSHARRFPWRETDDGYTILLAEVLLQRTQAPQVQDNYWRIATAFPTPHALAAAPLETVQEALRPLGLAKRAATLKRMGEELVTRFDGRVPMTVTDLITLPGVGRYIATATACFAAGARLAVLDANVVRVFSRFFGVTSYRKRPRDDSALWRLAESLLPRTRAADYNRALIDFAGLVCKARTPLCPDCTLRRRCRAAPVLSAETRTARLGDPFGEMETQVPDTTGRATAVSRRWSPAGFGTTCT